MRNPLASPRWWITGGFLLPVLLVGSAWLTTVIWPPEWSSDRTLTLAGQVSDDDDLFPATDPDFEPMRYASYRLTMQRNRNDSAYGYILMEVPPATLGLAKAALAHLYTSPAGWRAARCSIRPRRACGASSSSIAAIPTTERGVRSRRRSTPAAIHSGGGYSISSRRGNAGPSQRAWWAWSS
jgi:hypothetical protein